MSNTKPKVLWLSPTPGLFYSEQKGYGTGGWIAALQRQLCDTDYHSRIAICFLDESNTSRVVKDGFVYYTIRTHRVRAFKKLLEYYGICKRNEESYLNDIKKVIDDFRPDLIHVFGIESQLAQIIGHTNIPLVVHLQGLLSPIVNAYFPVSFSKYSFFVPFSLREWVLRNGFIHTYNDIKKKADKESSKFKLVKYFMGRTDFDYQLTKLLSPNSQYFLINEVLREEFYNAAGSWKRKDGQFVIVSTLSETVYKGLDLILKTALILKRETRVNFIWKIVGVNNSDRIVGYFENKLNIKGSSVGLVYTGVKDANSLVNILRDSSLYVHPSYIDNSPNSVCEAQLIGTPVIACNVGGVSSLVPNNSGILIPANAPYELAYYINLLSSDINISNQIGSKGNECALLRHDRTTILTNLFKTYEIIASQNG